MMPPEHVYTRQRAILVELGIAPSVVLADSFDADGCILDGDYPQLGSQRFGNAFSVRTKYRWPTPDISKRAIEARDGDFAETFGLNTPD